MKTGIVNTKCLNNFGFRIDPDIHLSDGVKTRRIISKIPYEISSVGENSEKVFLGNIFSRNFVSKPDHGVEYLAASDTVLADLHTGRYLSNTQAKELNYLMLKEGWILVTCSGTLGNVTYTNKNYCSKIATHDLIRIIPNDNKVKGGVLYAFLASKYGYNQITQSQFGGVVKHINEEQTKGIKVPVFPIDLQIEVDSLIKESALLREEAKQNKDKAYKILFEKANLQELNPENFDFYGGCIKDRQPSIFTISKKEITTRTINAFNHSARIANLKKKITCPTIPLSKALKDGIFFSTGSFPRVEVNKENGIMLINQSDIFDTIIKGKYISKRGVRTDNLVKYGEVIIAGVGTLGESESFCRTIFANEELEGQLVSGEFLRMETVEEIPSGYLFSWLSSEYGFRLIRSTQTGTKLCRPIQSLLLEQPVPIIDKESMNNIDSLIKESFTKEYIANNNVRKAISMIEQEIEKWNK